MRPPVVTLVLSETTTSSPLPSPAGSVRESGCQRRSVTRVVTSSVTDACRLHAPDALRTSTLNTIAEGRSRHTCGATAQSHVNRAPGMTAI